MQAKPKTPRRTKVKGKPGIYFRQVGRQRRYEITFLDSDGRRRWQTVPGFDNLDDADALLIDVKSKMHRGQRIAPGKLTFNEAVDVWFAGKNVEERTRERYESNLRLYLRPRFGDRPVHKITAEDVAALVATMQAEGKEGWTQRNVLTTLSSFFTWAYRHRGDGTRRRTRCSQLEPDERPKVRKRKGRVLQPDEIRALLDSATSDRYRMLIATAIFTGLRLMELLALRWQDVGDSEIYVRHQLSRMGKRLVDVKTDSGERDVALRPELAAMLKRHKMASRFKQPHDFVFASETGGPLGWRNVERRAMDAAHAAAVKAKRISATRRRPSCTTAATHSRRC
jgi:integrase